MTILLRSPAVLQEDPAFKEYLGNGLARLLKGDGLVEGDILAAWKDANAHVPVDVVLFSLGMSS